MARVRSQEEPWSGQTPAWLDARARAFPERPALVTGAHRWSFGQLDAAASRVAHWLAGSGITAGTRAAVLMRNGASFVATTHALTKLGAVMVPLHARLTKPELVRQLDGVGATAVICDGALAALGQAAALPTVRALVAEEPEPEPHDRSGGGALGEGLPCPRLSLSSIQGIVHTSATSGTPKGVLLTYGNHWWSAVGAALHLGLQRDDCWLACLPLSHVGGLAILWRSVIYGVPVILHDAFEPDVVNREIDDGRVTLISLVGTMLQRLIDARGQRPFPQRLRAILLGGGPISPGLLETCVRRRIPIAPTYGLTETASQVATLAPEDVSRKTGSAGQALFPTELRIAASGRRRTAPGQVGEILVRGPVVMRGYDGRPGDAAQVLHGGWLHTGDLGYLDADGYLYVVDRRTDLVVSGGENVYPAEVERVLQSHPAVEDTCVVGAPDPLWGQVVVAAVLVRARPQTNADELKAFCAERLAMYKVPKHVWFVDGLPRSAGGKLLRYRVRERMAELLRQRRS
ncbi:MAG TPA: o-succinylbenzoate--CoA ligase [bacterium]|nr:o-succinylbenzoate--CoA ligase [bacterium]